WRRPAWRRPWPACEMTGEGLAEDQQGGEGQRDGGGGEGTDVGPERLLRLGGGGRLALHEDGMAAGEAGDLPGEGRRLPIPAPEPNLETGEDRGARMGPGKGGREQDHVEPLARRLERLVDGGPDPGDGEIERLGLVARRGLGQEVLERCPVADPQAEPA